MKTKFFGVLLCLSCYSCGYNKKGEVTPVTNLNTTNNTPGGNTSIAVSYKNDISPIVQKECISCHGIYGDLGSYAKLQKYTISTSGKASELEGRIKGIDGWNRMPQGGALSQTDQDMIVNWINQGAQDN